MLLNFGIDLPDEDWYRDFLKRCRDASCIAVDTESDPAKDFMFLGSSIALPDGEATYFPCNLVEGGNISESLYREMMETVQAVPLRIMQHAGHDLMVFEKQGYPLDGPFACTMIMAHMVDEEWVSKSLDSLHRMLTGGVGKTRDPIMQSIIDLYGWSHVPVQLMYEYAKQDAVATIEVFRKLVPMYIEQFGPLYEEPWWTRIVIEMQSVELSKHMQITSRVAQKQKMLK